MVVLIFISTLITFFRYVIFSPNDDFSKPYEISDTVVDGIKADLNIQQGCAFNKSRSNELDIANDQVDLIDYEDIKNLVRYDNPKRETDFKNTYDTVVETKTLAELLGEKSLSEELTTYVEGSEYGPNLYNSYEGQIPYNSSKNGNVTFLRMTWSEYVELVKESCTKFNSAEYYNYDTAYSITYSVDDEAANEIAAVEEASGDAEVEAEVEEPIEESYTYEDGDTSVQGVVVVSEYNGISLSDYLADHLIDGDYFKMIDNKLYVFSPINELITYDKYGSTMISAISQGDYVYFLVDDDMIDILSGELVAGDISTQELFENEILSSYIYRTEEEAVYSTLDEESRNLFSDFSNSYYYYAYGSDTAYSLDGKELSGTQLYTGDDDLYSLRYTAGYEEYAKKLEQQSDIFIRYYKDSHEVIQWYRNKNGERVPYEYLSDKDLETLTSEVDEDFVLGVNLTNEYSMHSRDAFAFGIARYMSEPAIVLCFALIMFVSIIVLLTIGEPAKILLVDRAPYLVWLILYGGLIGVFLLLANILFKDDGYILEFGRHLSSLFGLVSFILLASYIATASLWMTVVRRIKAKKFWDGFFIIRFARWIFRGTGNLAHKFPGKIRGFVAIIAITLINSFALVLLAQNSYSPEPVIAVLVLIVLEIAMMVYILKYMSDMDTLLKLGRRLEAGELDAKVNPESMHLNAREMGDSLNNLGAGLQKAVDASLREERTKAELITNVSHDIKTPLTSIISYIDLLKREDIENEKALEYIEVLDKKSERLKQLILDLIEASKTSTGNIELECMNLSLSELLNQCLGEHEEKMNELGLEVVTNNKAEESLIYADGRRVFRVIDNLLNNVEKYAQPNTRVFIDLKDEAAEGSSERRVVFTMKNTSREMLNISAEELMERFVRGDRSRNTEGSGLGLSIARNLTELQNGTFDISIDGDHFRVEIAFPVVERTETSYESEEAGEIADESTEEVETTYETADPVNEADTPEDTEA